MMAAPLTGLSKFQNVGKAAGPSDQGSDWTLEAGLVLKGGLRGPGRGGGIGLQGHISLLDSQTEQELSGSCAIREASTPPSGRPEKR